MNRFLKNILVILGISLFAYPLMIFGYCYIHNTYMDANVSNQLGAYGHLFSRIREADSTKNVDILTIGSSLCYRGIDPRIFNKEEIQLFNLGSSGQTHIQTAILLDVYLEQLNPKTVIYECSPYIFYEDGVGSGLDLIYNSHLSSHHLDMALKIDNIKVYNGLINAFIRNTLGLDNDFIEPSIKGENTYIQGGFVEKKTSYFRHNLIDNKEKKTFEPVPYQWKLFLQNIQKIKHFGAELILISAPTTKYSNSEIAYAQSSDSIFSSLGKYLNFNHIMQLDDSLHFYDKNHLNQSGVKLFNDSLIKRLNI